MIENQTLLTLFFIFSGAAVVATIAISVRQTMLTAYLILGLILGPIGFNLIDSSSQLHNISHIGITFLLFLLGLDLSPTKLFKMIKSTTLPTLASCGLFGLLALPVAYFMNITTVETAVLAIALMFSSTIVGLKLLPTTVLHHKATGEIIISILLLQDILAIIALFSLQLIGQELHLEWTDLAIKLLSLPILIGIIWGAQRYILLPLLTRFSKIREYIFLLMIGWCLGIAQLTHSIGLSHEIGAFMAGVIIAINPIALYVADSLKPLRDFFLILFFVSLGTGLNLQALQEVILPAIALAGVILILKPFVFQFLFQHKDCNQAMAREVGVRLGQGSEFSLLIALVAYQMEIIGTTIQHLIEVTVLLTFIVSPYLIVSNYPSPAAFTDKLRRD